MPLGRLRSRLENKPSLSDIRGVHERRLSSEQDAALVLYLQHLINLGLHPRLRLVKIAATKLILQTWTESTPPHPISHAWPKRWMDRHPEFKNAKRKPLTAVRRNAEDPIAIQEYFNQFRQAIQEHGICEVDVWNFDETGFRMGIARADWILITIFDDTQSIRSKDPDNKESLIAIECKYIWHILVFYFAFDLDTNNFLLIVQIEVRSMDIPSFLNLDYKC